MQFLTAFLTGGAICVLGQLLIDKTALTGVALGALGLYQPLVAFAGEGAAVPIAGFGNLMAQGVRDALREDGALGILTGGVKSAAAGIAAAIVFSLCAALFSKSRDK